jgi:ferrous iron transport protein B
MLIGFVPLQGLVLASLYLLGILVAVVASIVIRKTLVRGPTADFVMELPPYRVPSLRNVGLRVYDRSKDFALKAGTIIFAMSIVVWALGYFPRSKEVLERSDAERAALAETLEGPELEVELDRVSRQERGALLRASLLGRMGHAIEPIVEPLGWDWRIGMAVLAAFPAREVVVSTLGIIYDLGEEGADEEEGLVKKIRNARGPDGELTFTLPVALSLMVFFALCCQCGATVATIKRETNSWRWAAFAFAYLTVLAYGFALVTYQVGAALA